MQHEQRRRRVTGDVDRQRRDELGEAVEVEMRAVGERRQPGQILVARLERAAGPQVEDRVPPARARARDVERKAEHQGERQHAGRERRRAIGRDDQARREGDGDRGHRHRDHRERVQTRAPHHDEGRRRGPQPAVDMADEHAAHDGRRGSEDDDSRNDVRHPERGCTRVGCCGHAPTPEPLAGGGALGALAGCGSQTVHELPPAAEAPRSPAAARTPAGTVTAIGKAHEGVVPDATTAAALDGGRRVAVVSARERRLDLYDSRTRRRIGRAPAGLGPTHVACLDRGPCYVADTRGDALLVFSVGAGVEPTRRYGLPGGPYGLALDRARRRLYVTLPGRNELVALVAHGRPHVVARLAHGAPAGLGDGRRAARATSSSPGGWTGCSSA